MNSFGKAGVQLKFSGGEGVVKPSKPPTNYFYLYPPTILRWFWKDSQDAQFLGCDALGINHSGHPGGVSPISHNALDQIIYMIFPPFCQVIHVLF